MLTINHMFINLLSLGMYDTKSPKSFEIHLWMLLSKNA